MEYAILVPTLNGGDIWRRTVESIKIQVPKPAKVLVIDSGSSDSTASVAEEAGFIVYEILQKEFDHGGTRNLGIQMLKEFETVVLLTQDAVLQESNSIAKLLHGFESDGVSAAYGRQLPRPAASPIETHARIFNYPEKSAIRSERAIPALGIKAAFCSNSFSAWRLADLNEVGGFPENSIFAEDMYAAAKLILMGKRVAYIAEAQCQHSHDYSIAQEFQRAFDIGVFHAREPWLLREFGTPQGEGMRFIFSQLRYVATVQPLLLPLALLNSLAKMIGYLLGKNEKYLPASLKCKFSMNKSFWRKLGHVVELSQ